MAREALGNVMRVTTRGALLVKAPAGLRIRAAGGPDYGARKDVVRIGSFTVDARNETVGKVTDVIGPVKSPYLVVTPPRGAKIHRLQGKEIYLS
jgi:rRNA processing protein Gar1